MSSVEPTRYPTSDDDKNIISLPPANVLLVDDDASIRRSVGADLSDEGYTVHAVETTPEASRCLNEREYQAVFVDIDLLRHDTPGDQFILANKERMSRAKVAVITGQDVLEKIGAQRRERLEKLQIPILTKGTAVFSNDMIGLVEEKTAEIRNDLIAKRDYLYGKNRDNTTFTAEEQLLKMLREKLLEWLRSRSKAQEKGIWYGGKSYSMEDIADEIEKNSEIGQAHLKMIVSLFSKQIMKL